MFDIVSLNWTPSDVPTTVALLFLVSGLLYRPAAAIIDSGHLVQLSISPSRLSLTFFRLFFSSRYMLLSPVIGIAIDKNAPSASALHMVLVLGFSLQALCFVLLKVRSAFQVFSCVLTAAFTAAPYVLPILQRKLEWPRGDLGSRLVPLQNQLYACIITIVSLFHRILFCPSVLVEAIAIAATIIPSGVVFFNMSPHSHRCQHTFLFHFVFSSELHHRK